MNKQPLGTDAPEEREAQVFQAFKAAINHVLKVDRSFDTLRPFPLDIPEKGKECFDLLVRALSLVKDTIKRPMGDRDDWSFVQVSNVPFGGGQGAMLRNIHRKPASPLPFRNTWVICIDPFLLANYAHPMVYVLISGDQDGSVPMIFVHGDGWPFGDNSPEFRKIWSHPRNTM